MKAIFKYMSFLLILSFLTGCENEKDPVYSTQTFLLSTVNPVNNQVLLPQNASVEIANFKWELSETTIQTEDTKYLLEIAKSGTNFSKPFYANAYEFISPNREYSLKVGEMNELLVKDTITFKCGQLAELDVRVKSVVGNKKGNSYAQYSNVINVKVTPYSPKIPRLAFAKTVGDIVSFKKMVTNNILSSEFEGYYYLSAGDYKFYKPNSCGDFSAAQALGGTALSGTLDASGSAITIPTTGHYLIKANLTTNTYSIKEFRTFGIFGSGVRISGTANAAPMTDNNDNIWKITVDLIKGRSYRFKSNLWTGLAVTPMQTNIGTVANPILVQFPDFIPPSGTTTISTLGKSSIAGQVVEVTGADGEFTVPGTFGSAGDRQKYEIVLDVSKPRNYTYTITAK
jgi:starch-binding outer membrane protein SusE/F